MLFNLEQDQATKYNNLDYLKLVIKSIQKNSKLPNEIILHVNEGNDGTLDYVKKNNYKFSYFATNYYELFYLK